MILFVRPVQPSIQLSPGWAFLLFVGSDPSAHGHHETRLPTTYIIHHGDACDGYESSSLQPFNGLVWQSSRSVSVRSSHLKVDRSRTAS